MDTASLVSLDISEGFEVVSALEKQGISLQVALWMITSEYEDGRLVIASEQLPRDIGEGYGRVVQILRETFVRALPLIMIMKLDDPFVVELRQRFGNAQSVNGMRLGGQTIGNRYVEDGYVYKIA